jgi:nitrite reductase (NADH) small subunit
MEEQWIVIGRLSDIPPRGARVVRRAEGNIAIFRTAGDEVFALADRCPHRGGPLSQGIVHGTSVTCPLHDWRIDLISGRAIAPDEGCVARYPVRIRDGMVELCVTASALAPEAA